MRQRGKEEARRAAAAPGHCVFRLSRSLPHPGALLWLLLHLVSPWQLSLSLHSQTTCLSFKEVIHIFNRNINVQELRGTRDHSS